MKNTIERMPKVVIWVLSIIMIIILVILFWLFLDLIYFGLSTLITGEDYSYWNSLWSMISIFSLGISSMAIGGPLTLALIRYMK